MKVSLNWLREYIEIDFSLKDLINNLTMLGMEIEEVEEYPNDTIIEVNLTINRGDCLSLLGLAQEISFINGKEIHYPQISSIAREDIKELIDISIKEELLCPQYAAKIIKNVKIKDSPSWLKEKLTVSGIKPINNIVDITNFVLLEYGQPMHAFDYDLIKDKKIIIRLANNGEMIKTLDGDDVILDKEILVIADNQRPIAIAGIIGGFDTAVTSKTKNILLESAHFNPKIIRKGSHKLNIYTESSYRFEREVDEEKIPLALERATKLILDENPDSIPTSIYYLKKTTRKEKLIELRIERVNDLLGTNLTFQKVLDILKTLKFSIISQKNNKLLLKIPTYRKDIYREVDVIEEIARIYGYNRIPTTIYHITFQDYLEEESIEDREFKLLNLTKNILNSIGFFEVVNLPFISSKLLNYSPFHSDKPVIIENPLKENENIISPTLLFGILNSISHNLRNGIYDLKFYEFRKIYYKSEKENLPNEENNLALAIAGKKNRNQWGKEERDFELFDLKNYFHYLVNELTRLDFSYSLSDINCFIPSISYQIKYNKEIIGILGELSPELLNRFKIPQKVFFLEINWDRFSKLIETKREFKSLPKYPPNFRDISIVLREDISYQMVLETIRELNHPYVKEIILFDIYRGKQIPENHKSLAFRITYQSEDKTLSDKEVDKIHKLIIERLTTKLKAWIR